MNEIRELILAFLGTGALMSLGLAFYLTVRPKVNHADPKDLGPLISLLEFEGGLVSPSAKWGMYRKITPYIDFCREYKENYLSTMNNVMGFLQQSMLALPPIELKDRIVYITPNDKTSNAANVTVLRREDAKLLSFNGVDSLESLEELYCKTHSTLKGCVDESR